MNIGIITFHRAYNYGAVLQCYALQRILTIIGGQNVKVIDYINPYIEWLYKPHTGFIYVIKMLLRLRFDKIKEHILSYRIACKRKFFFDEFRMNYLNCTQEYSRQAIPQDFDRYIIGSDQMWSLDCSGGIDNIYWGNFHRPRNSKLYGFSISTNGDYRKMMTREMLKNRLANFDGISFREQMVARDFSAINKMEYPVTLDPTLLTDAEIWEPLINKEWSKRKYVAIYQIRRLKNNPLMLEKQASFFAANTGSEIIDLSNMTYSVEDFVSIIKYAQAVFTSSFHATAFSVVFRKPLVAFRLYDGKDDRYVDLLKSLDLERHLVDENSKEIQPSQIKLSDEGEFAFKQMKKNSLSYLKKILES